MITIEEKLYNKMPDDIKACFNELPNPSRDEVVGLFPDTKSGGSSKSSIRTTTDNSFLGTGFGGKGIESDIAPSSGSASRFFYCAKASKSERNKGLEGFEEKGKVFNGQSDTPSKELKDVEERFNTQPTKNFHPTVKPIALMRYLCKLITPVGGTVLDPFTGSGSTGVAAKLEDFNFIGIELDADYCRIAGARIEAWEKELTLFDNEKN